VGQAEKLHITPDMTDTVRLRPEISYRITSTAQTTSFETRPFEAATINSATFEAGRPLYIRAGTGVPFQTAFDLYFTPRMRTGGTFGVFANHKGSYSKIANGLGVKAPATEMSTGLGMWGTRRWTRYSLEGDLTFDNRSLEMYGYSGDFDEPLAGEFKQDRVGWNRVGGSIGFGDDFTDMSHFNFRVEFDGGFTHRGGGLRHFNWDLLWNPFEDDENAMPPHLFPYSYDLAYGPLYRMEMIRGDLSGIPDTFLYDKKPWQADGRVTIRMGTMLGERQGFDAELTARYGATSMEYENDVTGGGEENNLFG
jgi:hypothetical protein